MVVNEILKERLVKLALLYETSDFLKDDPAQFMHRYSMPIDVEIVAFIASSLAFGQRPAILAKVNYICTLMDECPSQWLFDRKYALSFPDSNDKFYRFISYAEMNRFFDTIRNLVINYGTIGAFVQDEYNKGVSPLVALVSCFATAKVGNLVPRNVKSGCKRLNMFLRWMVRDHSPVDIGLWNWYDKSKLLMPADTHVMKEALRLGLIYNESVSMSTVLRITDALRQVWPDDPCKGDFALFGLGVNGE